MSKPPLWEVMRRAYDLSPPVPVDADLDWIDRHGYAAEIRAIVDEMVLRFDPWLAEHAAVAEWLRAEADCAERGREVEA